MNNDCAEGSTLRAIVDLRDQLQQTRIRFGNRKAAHTWVGNDEGDQQQVEVLDRWYEVFIDLEKRADVDIRRAVRQEYVYPYLTAVKGVGPLMAAKLIALIDIRKASTASALWKYAGYAVGKDGRADRPKKGEPLGYNKRLKNACWLIGTSFLRANSPYRKVYDDAREIYAESRPEWSNGRQHSAAMRKMVKRFLAHLWQVWRALEGLPVRSPYIEEYMGHSHIDEPKTYGWPKVGSVEPRGKQQHPWRKTLYPDLVGTNGRTP